MEKKKPHTELEKQLLFKIIKPHISELNNRKTDAVSISKKQEIWENMTKVFNSSPIVLSRVTPKQLKKMWQNLKAKEARTRPETQPNTNEGRPQTPESLETDPLESQDLAIIPNFMRTIDITKDIDVLDVENQEDDNDTKASLPNKYRDFTSSDSTSSQSECHARTTKRIAEESVEHLKLKIQLAELEMAIAKGALERKLMLEKHEMEMDILKLKREIVLQQFKNAK